MTWFTWCWLHHTRANMLLVAFRTFQNNGIKIFFNSLMCYVLVSQNAEMILKSINYENPQKLRSFVTAICSYYIKSKMWIAVIVTKLAVILFIYIRGQNLIDRLSPLTGKCVPLQKKQQNRRTKKKKRTKKKYSWIQINLEIRVTFQLVGHL